MRLLALVKTHTTGLGQGFTFGKRIQVERMIGPFITPSESSKELEQSSNPLWWGAVVDLGFCLDLISTNGLRAVEQAYGSFRSVIAASGAQIPENVGGSDLYLRRLDCAVINFLHDARKKADEQEFDTVRAVFTEGEPLYLKSGFKHKTHIQICVRKQSAIKAVFRVPPDQLSPSSPVRDPA